MDDVHIERFKLPNKTWDGELGELWLVTPEKRLILSYRDIAASMATGSKSADVTAELVYVGRGDKESDYTGKNVAGKLVIGSGSVGTMPGSREFRRPMSLRRSSFARMSPANR